MFRLRPPLVVASRQALVRVGAFSPNVDYVVPVVVSGAVGFLFGRVLWGCTGALIGGALGLTLGVATMASASVSTASKG